MTMATRGPPRQPPGPKRDRAATPPCSEPEPRPITPATMSAPPPRTAVIDHMAYPHLVDAILAHADHDVLLAFRAVSRAYRDRVDRAMVADLVVGPGVRPGGIRWRSAARPESIVPIKSIFSTRVARVPRLEDSSARPMEEYTRTLTVEPPFTTEQQWHAAGEYISRLSHAEVVIVRPTGSTWSDVRVPGPLQCPPRARTLVMFAQAGGGHTTSYELHFPRSIRRVVVVFELRSKRDMFWQIPVPRLHLAKISMGATLVILFTYASSSPADSRHRESAMEVDRSVLEWPLRHAYGALRALVTTEWREIQIVGRDETVADFLMDGCRLSPGERAILPSGPTFEETARRMRIMSPAEYVAEGGQMW